MKVELIKENEKGKVYQAGDFKIFYRSKDSVSGDNSKNVKEVIYLITGSAKITIEDSVLNVDAPVKIKIPAKTYHKIEALTDISFILFD